MKKYNKVALNVQSIALEANIMGASGGGKLVAGGTAAAGTQNTGDNGDGLGRATGDVDVVFNVD